MYTTGAGKSKRQEKWPEGGLTLEHIADRPITFKSRKSLTKYCAEKGLSSGALS